MTATPLYRKITSEEFSRERTRQFATDSPEVTGIRFVTISHDESERLRAEWGSQDWQSRLGPISQVMPLDYEGYAGIVLPFVAYRGQERHEVDGPSEAYRSFGLSLPASVTLDQLYDDFQVIEGCKAIPGVVRAVLDRFAGAATTVMVKSPSWRGLVHASSGRYADSVHCRQCRSCYCALSGVGRPACAVGAQRQVPYVSAERPLCHVCRVSCLTSPCSRRPSAAADAERYVS